MRVSISYPNICFLFLLFLIRAQIHLPVNIEILQYIFTDKSSVLFLAVDAKNEFILLKMNGHVIPNRLCEGVRVGHGLPRFGAHVDTFVISERKGISRHDDAELEAIVGVVDTV